MRLEPPTKPDAVEVRHLQIRDDYVRQVPSRLRERRLAVTGQHDPEIVRLERELKREQRVAVFVDQ